MARAWGYCRISKGRDKHIYSLEVQEDIIKRTFDFKSKDWQIEKLILPPFMDVAVSGRNVDFTKRAAACKLIGRCRKGDLVIFPKVDRAFRSNQDCFQTMAVFKTMGVRTYFCDLGFDTSTAIGNAILTICVAFAQLESDRMSERTREANEKRKYISMKPTKPAPIGWRYSFRGMGRPYVLIEYPYARRLGMVALKMALRGMDNHEIGQAFHKRRMRHLKSPKNTRWTPELIRRLIYSASVGWPVSDEEAEAGPVLPVFPLEEGDTPIRPQGIHDADCYPAVEGFSNESTADRQ